MLIRGCQWAATGEATYPVPRDFPTPTEIRLVPASNDPVAAIRSVLPEGWRVLKVEKGTHPFYRPKGRGTAVFLVSSAHKGIMPPYDAAVYIMPPDYQDGGEDPTHGQAQTDPPRRVAATPAAETYLWAFRSRTSAKGWPTLRDDILKALVR